VVRGDDNLEVALPSVTQEFEDTRTLMGDNFWRYGVKANRKELELAETQRRSDLHANGLFLSILLCLLAATAQARCEPNGVGDWLSEASLDDPARFRFLGDQHDLSIFHAGAVRTSARGAMH